MTPNWLNAPDLVLTLRDRLNIADVAQLGRVCNGPLMRALNQVTLKQLSNDELFFSLPATAQNTANWRERVKARNACMDGQTAFAPLYVPKADDVMLIYLCHDGRGANIILLFHDAQGNIMDKTHGPLLYMLNQI